MRILNFEELHLEKQSIVDAIINGAVFIHPTDTIYGIGCNAQISNSVKKIRQLKGRAANPFSVIAPSLEWIKDNCVVSPEAEAWLKKLPGPYTLILRLKNKGCIAKEVTQDQETLGVRIPDHWISNFVNEIEIPIISTSVNKSNEDFMTSLEDLDNDIKSEVDFVVYEGAKKGKPSKIIDLTEYTKVIKR